MKLPSPPLVTIAIPTYDRPDLLKRTLTSVVAQSYSNLEVLVSDDCSPGIETKQAVMQAQEMDQRIRYFRQEKNLSYEANFEFLLKEAEGEYIMWLSDDDILQPEAIQSMVAAMTANRRAIVCGCDIQFIDGEDKPLRLERLEGLYNDSIWKEKRKLFFAYPTTNIYLVIVGLYRTEAMRKLDIIQEPNCYGYYTNLEVPYLARLSLVGEIIAIPQQLFLYRSHGDSTYIKEMASISLFDHFMLRLCIRLRLLSIAVRAEVGLWERAGLLKVIAFSSLKGAVRNVTSVFIPTMVKNRIKVFFYK